MTLVTCTLGEEGEVIGSALALLVAAEADQLGGYRMAERAAACAALGVADHRYLGGAGRWRDSGMAHSGHGVRATGLPVLHPRAFSAPEAFGKEVEALVAVLEEVRPQVVVTYAADGGYGHPDHVRAHEITVAALGRVPARLMYTVVGRRTLDAGLAALGECPFVRPAPDELPSVPDATVTTRLDVRAQRERRVAAMRAHATQVLVAPDERTFAMSNLVAQPILDVEEYVAADGLPTPDLFGAELAEGQGPGDG